ncbi:MAG: aminotransferase class III-fold pyridoxal phosphate-dependent enzyme, partial [Patescibacteria group bacterium]
GFRRTIGGVHLLYGINPDIAVLGKAISNGYPMAAVIGKKEIMTSAEDSFISSTYWTERVGPTAAIATIKKMIEQNVPEHLDKIGKIIAAGWRELADKHKLNISIGGPMALVNFSFEYDNAQEIKTLFTQEMLKRGYLASLTVYVSFSHKEEHIKSYLKAVDEVFFIIAEAIKENKVNKLLEGPAAYSGFQRLT